MPASFSTPPDLLSGIFAQAQAIAALGLTNTVTLAAGALQAANNLSDVASAAMALSNLGGAPQVSPVFTGAVNAGSASSVIVPTVVSTDNSMNAASTAFVQTAFAAASTGLTVLTPVAALSAANINLASPGFTTLDGVALTSGVSRVGVVGQTTASQNGVYQFNGASSAMTRTTDANQSSQFTGHQLYFFVLGGTTYGDSSWVLQTTGTIILGTTALAFAQFSTAVSYSPGTGLLLTGTVFSVNETVIAALASPAFTGTPTAPTAAGSTSTTQIATTAFVKGLLGTAAAKAASNNSDSTLASTTGTVSSGGFAVFTDAVGTIGTGSIVVMAESSPPSAPSAPDGGIKIFAVAGEPITGGSGLAYITPYQTVYLPGRGPGGDVNKNWWGQPMGISITQSSTTPTDVFRIQNTWTGSGASANPGNLPAFWVASTWGSAATPIKAAPFWPWPNQTTFNIYFGGTITVTALAWASTGGGQVTATTASAHGVSVGDTFKLVNNTPTGYNQIYTAIAGTTGSTLVGALTTNPGAATGFGYAITGSGSPEPVGLNVTFNNYLQHATGDFFGFNIAKNDFSGASSSLGADSVLGELDHRASGPDDGCLADGTTFNPAAIGQGANRRGLDMVMTWSGIPIQSMAWAGGFVTITTAIIQPIQIGQTFIVNGALPTAYNGNFVAVSGTNATTVVFALATNPGAVTTNGSVGLPAEFGGSVINVGNGVPANNTLLPSDITIKDVFRVRANVTWAALNMRDSTFSNVGILMAAADGHTIAWTADTQSWCSANNEVSQSFATIGAVGTAGAANESLVLSGAANGNIQTASPLFVGSALLLGGRTTYTPSTGFNLTMANSDPVIQLFPSGTLAAGTVTMCAAPADGQMAYIVTKQTISSFTVAPNSGQSISGAPSTITAQTPLAFIYDQATTTWLRMQ